MHSNSRINITSASLHEESNITQTLLDSFTKCETNIPTALNHFSQYGFTVLYVVPSNK
jgi:hypothetical protein